MSDLEPGVGYEDLSTVVESVYEKRNVTAESFVHPYFRRFVAHHLADKLVTHNSIVVPNQSWEKEANTAAMTVLQPDELACLDLDCFHQTEIDHKQGTTTPISLVEIKVLVRKEFENKNIGSSLITKSEELIQELRKHYPDFFLGRKIVGEIMDNAQGRIGRKKQGWSAEMADRQGYRFHRVIDDVDIYRKEIQQI